MSDADATQARRDVVADVDEILEHIINANMLSMPYDVYSELFDAVAGLGVEIENLQAENAKLRELVRDLWLTGSLCDAIPDMRLQAKGGDWRTMQERVDEALGIEVDDD